MIAENLYPKYFKKEYEAKGVYLAAGNYCAPYQIATRKAVRKLEDLKGLKIRAHGIAAETIRALGAVPVSLPGSEFYTALQRDVIDGVYSDIGNVYIYRCHEFAKYITEGNFGTVSVWMCMNPKFFDSLSREFKTILYNSFRRMTLDCGYAFDELSTESSKRKMIEAGVEVIKLSSKELARWKASTDSIWDEFVEKNEGSGRPAKQMLKDMTKLAEKYETMTVEQIRDEVMNHPVQGIIDFK